MSKEKELWYETTPNYDKEQTVQFGPYFSTYFRTDPKHLAFTLSRYKFIAKMAQKKGSIIELGCSEGLGTALLKENATRVLGVDFDHRTIKWAKGHHADEIVSFVESDILDSNFGIFDTVVSLDVIEHIYPENEHLFVRTVINNLADNGIAIIGTPNITAEKYASRNDQHVNLFDSERLESLFKTVFHNVFSFGMNDEVIHTGFSPMCHYLFVVCANPKQQ